MPEPLTLTLLGGVVAAEGIKFLYGQASELLAAWRRRRQEGGDESSPLAVPVVATSALDAPPADGVADSMVLAREDRTLVRLTGALSPYAQGQADIDPTDEQLAENAGQLRDLLEEIYHQRFTLKGEVREPTGSTVTVRQRLGEVAGSVTGADAAVEGAGLHVEQDATTVSPGGSVTGFTGSVRGESRAR